MRTLGWMLLLMALGACESSVDLCGNGEVCGTDGVSYLDTCALEAAGATIDHAGMCSGDCRVCGDFECYGEPVFDARGCPTCTCECSADDCPDGLTCVAGACVPKDGGVPPADGSVPDAVPSDGSGPDGGCDVACESGTCVDGVCIYPCGADTVDCDDDGMCETRLGRVDSCSDCGDDCTTRAPRRSTPMCLDVAEGCAFPCFPDWDRCGGSENCDTYLLDNRAHCGACGRLCESDQICDDGSCSSCEGTTRCGNRCVELDTDGLNCGACGVECESTESCVGGGCIPTRCLNPDDPAWSCSGIPSSCSCSCGGLSVNVAPFGLVTCPESLPGMGCDLDTAVECSEYNPHEVAACCL